MIIAQLGEQLRVTTQNDHAHFAGELLSLWTRDGLPTHPRRRQLLFAARQHDNGWRETDSAPHCNPATKRPHDFLSLPFEERKRLWNRGLHRFAETEPYASALILRHALNLHRSRVEDPAWRETLNTWREIEQRGFEDPGLSEKDIESDYPWIDLSDLLSLGFSAQWPTAFERYGYRAYCEPETLFIDPFPLAGETTFRIPYRLIEDRDYTSDTDLGLALASARWQELAVRVRPYSA